MQTPAFKFYIPVEVRYSDLDPQWQVNNTRYLVYMEQARLEYLRGFAGPYFRQFADRARAQLTLKYGARAKAIEYAELFEICEYGSPPDESFIAELFPK